MSDAATTVTQCECGYGMTCSWCASQLENEIEQQGRAQEALNVLEYAANHIEGNSRRGVFIKAYVEQEQWALDDFENFKKSYK